MEAALREATLEDVAALTGLMRGTFRDTFRHYPPEELEAYLAESYSEVLTRQTLLLPTRRTWVLERAGELVGYAVAGECDLPHREVTPSSGQLHRLYVRRDLQGSGHAKKLMATGLAWLAEEGRSPLFIGVWEGNARALAFYRRYGFEPIGEYPYPVGSTIDRELILRRD